MTDAIDWDDWLEAIEVTGVNLTVWEQEFIESLRLQRDAGRNPTERQVEILERIYTDRVP